MSATAYSDPYKLPAGVLALAVHGAFFVFLYFGVSWQTQPPQGMVVDIWDSLPESQINPVMVEPPPLAQAEPPPPVKTVPASPPPKADIESKADIQIEKEKPQAKPVEIRPPVVPPKPVMPEKTDAGQVELDAWVEQQARAERQRVRAEQASASGKVVDEYIEKIKAKIKHKIILPPNVPDNAKAEFAVTLLPGGSVLSVKLVKPSGVEAYDRAVEHAILLADPLPLPPDGALFSRFRELHLKFSARE